MRIHSRTIICAIAGLGLALGLPGPAGARQYSLNGTVYGSLQECENALKRHAVMGSVAGGAAGALLGTSVSHSHGLGAGIGGVAGATVGGRVAQRGTCTPVGSTTVRRVSTTTTTTATTNYKLGDCALGADKLISPAGTLVTTKAVKMCLTGGGWALSP